MWPLILVPAQLVFWPDPWHDPPVCMEDQGTYRGGRPLRPRHLNSGTSLWCEKKGENGVHTCRKTSIVSVATTQRHVMLNHFYHLPMS